MKLEIDAEFASLIPALDAEEYMQLEANIFDEGCRDPLVAWGDILIDGHNRLRICEKHDIPYSVVKREFTCRDDAKQYIILNQFGRRNLSIGDRSLLALQLEPIFREKARENQMKSPGRGKKGSQVVANLFSGVDTGKEIAKIAGVSHTTIDRAKRIMTQGTPEQIKRIKIGGVGNTVNAVYKELRESKQRDTPDESTPKSDPPSNVTNGPAPPVAILDRIPEQNPMENPAMLANDLNDTTGEADGGLPELEEPYAGEDDLEQIKRYVQELKNPDIDRSFTPDMLMIEYEAFAERFIRSMSTYEGAPYSGLYPVLSDEQRGRINMLNTAMIRTVQHVNMLIEGKQP